MRVTLICLRSPKLASVAALLLGLSAASDCDMDECYYLSGSKYAPAMLDEPKSQERTPAHCMARCSRTAGCERFTFFHRPEWLPGTNGDCTLHDANSTHAKAVKGALSGPARWPACCFEVPRLVDEIVTFGGVAISYPAGSNPGDTCIKGLRIFTQNTRIPGGGYGEQDDAAAMFTRFPHVRSKVLVLRDAKDRMDSEIFSCVDDEATVEISGDLPERMPLMKAARYQHWPIHSLDSVYEKRIKEIRFDNATLISKKEALLQRKNISADDLPFNMSKDVFDQLVEFTVKIVKMGSSTYADDFSSTIKAVEEFPPWRLVGWARTLANPRDPDMIVLIQHPDNGLCTINFEGSDSLADFASFGTDYGTGFCGFSNAHVGVRNELWQMVASTEYEEQIKKNLPYCRNVGCVGHSLGGALCELFVQCANSNRKGDPDYDMLAWEPAGEWKLLPAMTIDDDPTVRLSQVYSTRAFVDASADGPRSWTMEISGLAAIALIATTSLLVSRRRHWNRAATRADARDAAAQNIAGDADALPFL